MATAKVQVRRRENKQELLPIEIDGDEYFFTVPTDGQLALAFMSIGAEDVPFNEQLSAMLGFLRDTLEQEGYLAVRKLLRDPDVEEPMEVVTDLFKVIAETAGDPTTSSSDSTPSRAGNGASSTASSRSKASTPSASRRAASRT